MRDSTFRPLGGNRYGFIWEAPWGQRVPAEMIVTTRRGWSERAEARDPRWAAFVVGPAVVAIRLEADLPTRPAWQPPRTRIPAEWN